MEKITFTCETITPMFLAGADGQKPELRAPSIKGALRFWWRAMNGHLSLEELKEREAEIFGGTNPARRSRVVIKIEKSLNETFMTELLPHRKGAWKSKAFHPERKFVISFLMTPKIFHDETKEEIYNVQKMKALFLVVALLGGVGKRSRRGFGSFKINKINGEYFNTELNNVAEIEALIKKVNPQFSYSSSARYPVIEKIEIGSKNSSLKEIGLATHNLKGQNKSAYEATIGAGKPRFASPIYISILPNQKPIITTLKTVSPRPKPRDITTTIQTKLKNKIL